MPRTPRWPLFDPPPPAAFWDVDGTLLPATTSALFARMLVRERLLPPSVYGQSLRRALEHKLGWLDYPRVLHDALQQLAPIPLIRLERLAYENFAQNVKPRLFQGVTDHVDTLRRQGTPVVLISSSPGFILQPLALYLRADHLITTELTIAAGRLQGLAHGPPCYGPGKVTLARAWCDQHRIALDESIAYTDNWSDRFLLRQVRKAVVVRPGLRLRWLARRHGWTIIRPLAANGSSSFSKGGPAARR